MSVVTKAAVKSMHRNWMIASCRYRLFHLHLLLLLSPLLSLSLGMFPQSAARFIDSSCSIDWTECRSICNIFWVPSYRAPCVRACVRSCATVPVQTLKASVKLCHLLSIWSSFLIISIQCRWLATFCYCQKLCKITANPITVSLVVKSQQIFLSLCSCFVEYSSLWSALIRPKWHHFTSTELTALDSSPSELYTSHF